MILVSAGSDAGGDPATNAGLSYRPYGDELSSAGSAETPYEFVGEWIDNTGLIYLRARYHEAAVGRFISRDPIFGILTQPGTQHPYIYARNNPVLYIDPNGEFAFIPLLLVAAAGGFLGGIGYYAIQTYLNSDQCNSWDWGEALLWSGVGTGFGVVIGVGIYGGWWLGTQIGWWGSITTEALSAYECTRRGIVVLGRLPAYINTAKDIGGRYLNIPKEVWNQLSVAERWAINQKFLDEAIARCDYFYLVSRWAEATIDTFFRMELEYLFSLGYTISLHQNYLIPPIP